VPVHDWRYAFMVDFISPIMGCLGVTSYFVTVGRHGHPYLRDGLEWPVEHRIRDPSRSGVSSLHRRRTGSCLSLSLCLVSSPSVSFGLSLSSAICFSLSGYTVCNHSHNPLVRTLTSTHTHTYTRTHSRSCSLTLRMGLDSLPLPD